MEATSEVWTIASQEFRRTTRSARVVVFLALYLLFTAIVVIGAHVINKVVDAQVDESALKAGMDREELEKNIQERRQEEMEKQFGDKALADSLKDVPFTLFGIFFWCLLFLPVYVMLLGFDQISGEVGPRSIRYITVRANRGSILFGKYLGQAMLLLGMLAIIHIALFIYSLIAFKSFGFALAAVTFGRFAVASFTFALAWLGLTTLCSTAFRTPVVSLVANFIFLLLFLFMHVIGWAATGGEAAWRKTLALVRFASPTYYWADLLHPQLSRYGLSVLAFAGFGVAFVLMAWAILRARDV